MTKNYINMYEKAKEIQKLWKPELGDRIVQKNLKTDTVFYVGEEDINYEYCMKYAKDEYIWLPTQEQLQEMWWDKESALHLKDMFHRFSNTLKIYADYFYLFLSPNELWLAFIMKEKWNKIWTGKDWEIIKR